MLNKNHLIISIILISIIVTIKCDEEGSDKVIEIKQFLKNVGDSLQKGADKVSENAKMIGENIKKTLHGYKDRLNVTEDNVAEPSSTTESNIPKSQNQNTTKTNNNNNNRKEKPHNEGEKSTTIESADFKKPDSNNDKPKVSMADKKNDKSDKDKSEEGPIEDASTTTDKS